MEVYILNSLWQRVDIVDKFVSLVWTENFTDPVCDFELIVLSTLENRKRFVPGTKLAMNLSYRVMVIETVTDETDEEGRQTLKIVGPSLEDVLKQRVSYSIPWTDTPKNLVQYLLNKSILDSDVTEENIPDIIEDTIFPADTIAEPTEEVRLEIPIKTTYEHVKDLCDNYNMGVRIVRDPATSLLYIDVYMGSDRTTQQTTLPAVVFSPDMENLRNTKQLSTIQTFKNVANVYGGTGDSVVYADGVPTDTVGFDRRVIGVDASDIDDSDEELAEARRIQRGKEALAKCRPFQLLDGEVAKNNQYTYGVDYRLGDLVELRDARGTTSIMQVTQHIFTEDDTGERSYPTLLINTFIYPGTWLSWDITQEWDEMTTEHWDELD